MALRDQQCNDAPSQAHVGHVLVTKLCVYNVLLPELHSELGIHGSVRYRCKKTTYGWKVLGIKVRMYFFCFVLGTMLLIFCSSSMVKFCLALPCPPLPLPLLVPWWTAFEEKCFSLYIFIFVFAARFRARWLFSSSLDLILWHLPWKGTVTDVHSLNPCFHRRKKATGSENEQVITATKCKQGFWNSCFWNEWWECSCDPSAIMPHRFMNARFSINVDAFCGWNRMMRRTQTFFLASCNSIC